MNKQSPEGSKSTVVRYIAAVVILVFAVLTAAFAYHHRSMYLVLSSEKTGEVYARYPVRVNDIFGIGFIHSVNKSPVTDYYEVRKDGIYVVRTVYYGFGAGVQTELNEGQTLEYGSDGSMDDLVYFVGTVSDHTLTLGDRQQISLRTLCGKNAMVRISLEKRGLICKTAKKRIT